jgi:hypothetical protein
MSVPTTWMTLEGLFIQALVTCSRDRGPEGGGGGVSKLKGHLQGGRVPGRAKDDFAVIFLVGARSLSFCVVSLCVGVNRRIRDTLPWSRPEAFSRTPQLLHSSCFYETAFFTTSGVLENASGFCKYLDSFGRTRIWNLSRTTHVQLVFVKQG